jgi:tryptophanyl-tRNA synthetase
MTTTAPAPQRFLSGVQPSDKLHIGNYFGAIRQHIALQNEGPSFYFIADYHALTTLEEATRRRLGGDKIQPKDRAATLRGHVLDVALDYLALGLDPDKAVFFRQSDVPEVCELSWILCTVAGMGLLERAVSYKEKIEKGLEASVGLFTYPVLMAADILLYRSNVVPVGKDQVQHLEMTRDIAERFNRLYGEVFPIPTYRLNRDSKVPGVDGQKMSKSYGNAIQLFAEGNALKKVVMSIVTDSKGVEDPKTPETCTVFALYSLFASEEEKEALAARYRAGGMGYGEAKKMLLEKINAFFGPLREAGAAGGRHGGAAGGVLSAAPPLSDPGLAALARGFNAVALRAQERSCLGARRAIAIKPRASAARPGSAEVDDINKRRHPTATSPPSRADRASASITRSDFTASSAAGRTGSPRSTAPLKSSSMHAI